MHESITDALQAASDQVADEGVIHCVYHDGVLHLRDEHTHERSSTEALLSAD